MKIVQVGFDVPLDKLFDYRFDAASESDIGSRVLAPFGQRAAVGGPALGDAGDLVAQIGDEGAHGIGVGLEVFGTGVQLGV